MACVALFDDAAGHFALSGDLKEGAARLGPPGAVLGYGVASRPSSSGRGGGGRRARTLARCGQGKRQACNHNNAGAVRGLRAGFRGQRAM